MSDEIFKFLGQVIAFGGGSAAVAYLLFQYLGKTWIENKFAERLSQMEHDHALELQRLRIEIDSLISGTLKLQESEFKLLPEAWHKLDEAYGLVSAIVAPFQSYHDLDRMSSEQLREFLESTDFSATEKLDVRTSGSRLQTYKSIEFRYRAAKVDKSIRALRDFVARNGIFFPVELKSKFTLIIGVLWESLGSMIDGSDFGDYKLQREGWAKVKEEAEPTYRAIESEIQARLRSHSQQVEPRLK